MFEKRVNIKMIFRHYGIFAAIIFLFVAVCPPASAEVTAIELTTAEKAWLADHPVIRVHNEEDWPPFNFAKDGKPQGFSIDYMDILAERLGITVEYITGPTWNEFLGMLKNKDLDVMLNIVKTEERMKYILYTPPYFRNPNVIVSLEEGTSYTSAEQLAGKTVAIPKGFYQEEVLKKSFPEIKRLPVGDVLESLKAVLYGKADATIAEITVAQDVINRNMLTGLRLSGELDFGNPDLANLNIGIRDDWPILQSILIKTMDSITPEEIYQFQQKWLVGSRPDTSSVVLTKEEKLWLANHPTLILGVDPAWAPLEFINEDGEYSGITSSFIETISQRLDIELNPIPNLTWSQVIAKAKKGEIDILPAVVQTVAREEYLDFTKPYVSSPVVIATRSDAQFIHDLRNVAGRKVGVVKDYYLEEVLASKYPGILLVPCSSLADGLKALDGGEIDAFVGSLITISYAISHLKLMSIKIAAPTDLKFELCMGVRKNSPELLEILNKSLDSISFKEKEAFSNAWMDFKIEYGLQLKTILFWALPIGGAILLIIGFVLIWNRKLFLEVENRKKIEQKLQFTQYAMDKAVNSIFWISPDTAMFTYVNEAACSSLKYGRDELLSMQVSQIDINFSPEQLQQFIADLRQKDFVIIESRHQTKSGHTLEVELTCYITDFGGQETIVALAKDITVQKRMMAALQESEEYSRLLLESVGEGIAGIDNKGKIIFVNPATVEMLEFSEEELVGNSWHDLVQHSKEDGAPYPQEDCPVHRSYTLGAISHNHEGILWRRDDSHFPVSFTATPIMKNSEVMGAMVTFRDITDQKSAAEGLQKRLSELTEARLSMLNMMEDLEDTRKEAENRNIELNTEVTERKKMEDELRLNMEDLEKFSSMAIGREEKMIELKEEINELLAKAGREEKYKIVQ